jgi:hypothetical protein
LTLELLTLAKLVEVGSADDQLKETELLGKLGQLIGVGIKMVTEVKGFDIFLERMFLLVPIILKFIEFYLRRFRLPIE